ncbi:MAG: dihydrolipoamide acetyltransferase family protein [Spirochaetia bacterium]
MATPLRMPDMGTVEGTVTLVRWLKAEGDLVSQGEPLFEAETDKGLSEVEAAVSGVLVKKLVADGGRVNAGETIALIQGPGEAAGSAPPPSPHGAPGPVAPVIRALAERHGVDLASLKGTGPGGRVTRQDVVAAKETTGRREPTRPTPEARPPAESHALSHSQSMVARRVSQSHREKPTYHVHARVDMTAVIAARERAKTGGLVTSWDSFFVKACAIAVNEMPVFRRWISGETLSEHLQADVAVAIGVGDDLHIPAVRGAAGKNVAAITAEIGELARKAESRSLGPREIEGSCVLVSNLGMFPVESFDAIIYPEHAAALAAGAVTPTPVSDGTRTWIAPLAHLTLTVDHRLINGRTAAQFIARVKEILENGVLS